MILPDVNVLVFAYRRESRGHASYARWLSDVVSGADEVAQTESTLVAFLRIVTNRRIFADPAPTRDALTFVDGVRSAARARRLEATPSVWTAFTGFAAGDDGVRGNVVPDAWLAALAVAHGCRVATADRGFSRFPGLDWFDPARAGGTTS